MSELGFTIEQLVSHSGFKAGTIYDLTSKGVLSPPVRGIDPRLYGSKGLYPVQVKAQLDRYKALKRSGLKKSRIVSIMQAELREGATDVSL